MNPISRICLLGFGEVGQKLSGDLSRHKELLFSSFDILFPYSSSAPSLVLKSMSFVRPAATAHEAAAGSDLIISAVTAAEALTAARSVCEALAPDTIFLDLNSVAPDTRRQAGKLVEGSGGLYVEAAVMSAIHPRGVAAPMLLGGPHARNVLPLLQELGFSAAVPFAAELGPASATKMCRSVLVKGLEALLAESLLAARYYGVEDDVLASLGDQLPADDWAEKSRYMISRSLQHGVRRAEEMREVMKTVEQAGIEPLMSGACARRQAWAARYAAALGESGLSGMLDAIARMAAPDGQSVKRNEPEPC